MTASLIVRELEQAFLACPSQWEGRLEDGHSLCIRDRQGTLSVHIGPAGGSIDDAVGSEPWVEEADDRHQQFGFGIVGNKQEKFDVFRT